MFNNKKGKVRKTIKKGTKVKSLVFMLLGVMSIVLITGCSKDEKIENLKTVLE